MNPIKRGLLGLFLAAFGLAASAQYPVQNPVYIPDTIFSETTVTGTSTASSQVPTNGLSTMYIRVSGSPTTLTFTVQATESRGASPVWQTVPVINVATGAEQTAVTGTGLFSLNASGWGQVRVNTSANSGSYILSMSGGPGITASRVGPLLRKTYATTISAAVPASAATDILALPGNATNVVRLTAADCVSQGSVTGITTVGLVKYSVASTGGTSATTTVTALDTLSPTASSVPRVYTANPSAGTGGTVAVSRVLTSTPLTPTGSPAPVRLAPGAAPYEQQVVLRGVAEQAVISGLGNTFPSGATLSCTMTWTEE